MLSSLSFIGKQTRQWGLRKTSHRKHDPPLPLLMWHLQRLCVEGPCLLPYLQRNRCHLWLRNVHILLPKGTGSDEKDPKVEPGHLLLQHSVRPLHEIRRVNRAGEGDWGEAEEGLPRDCDDALLQEPVQGLRDAVEELILLHEVPAWPEEVRQGWVINWLIIINLKWTLLRSHVPHRQCPSRMRARYTILSMSSWSMKP